jgi:adenylosuccinate lyase/3-carboxy-cis,cis-muconate cycloisomerase
MFNSNFTRHWFDQQAMEVWSDNGTLQAWLDVEVALAKAQADLGIIPRAAADTIAKNGRSELFDLGRISAGIQETMHPLVPVLREFEALCGDEAAGMLHWGVTTQNIFETGAVLQLRKTHQLTVSYLMSALRSIGELARKNKDVVQAGRTHGQHALPITFGFKVAGWHAELRRELGLLESAGTQAFVVRLGGGVGTFAAMRGEGSKVQTGVADILGLGVEEMPLRSAFDRFTHYIAVLGMIAATAQKIGEEIVFLQRTEVAEVEESFHHGKVGSSTMAQKRNPQKSQNLIGLSRLLRGRVPLAFESMVRDNEGDASASNVADVLVPEVAVIGASIALLLGSLMDGLTVNADQMKRNVLLSGGMIVSEAVMMELAGVLGRHTAHHVLYDAAMDTVEHGGSFEDAIRRSEKVVAHADRLDLNRLLDPGSYLGESAKCVEEEVSRN